jgi:hypothetical protein
VVLDGSGGYSTVLTQTGTITAISPTSITVRSEDGYSQTYVIPNTAGNAGPPFAVDDHVVLRAAQRPDRDRHQHRQPAAARTQRTGRIATPELVAYPPPFEKPSGTEAVTVGLAIDVASSAGAVVDVVVSPSVISGPSPTVPGASLNTTASVPIATSAPAPIPAATSFS